MEDLVLGIMMLLGAALCFFIAWLGIRHNKKLRDAGKPTMEERARHTGGHCLPTRDFWE